MDRIDNLSSRLDIPTAEVELTPTEQPMGQSVGGLSMYSNSFKRGQGDRVFGSDDNGIWLGKADFDNAPVSITMEGAMLIHDGTTYRGIFGNDGS